jgi:hypothetical protein
MRNNRCETLTGYIGNVMAAPFKLVNYIARHPMESMLYLLTIQSALFKHGAVNQGSKSLVLASKSALLFSSASLLPGVHAIGADEARANRERMERIQSRPADPRQVTPIYDQNGAGAHVRQGDRQGSVQYNPSTDTYRGDYDSGRVHGGGSFSPSRPNAPTFTVGGNWRF